MTIETNELLTSLDSVTSIPAVPFRNGKVDYEAHAKNIRYLMDNNYLDGDRRRVIGIAGTSLIHHIALDEQVRLIGATGEQMQGKGVLMAGIAPNPIADAQDLIRREAALQTPPDCYLLMPLTGVANAEGIFRYYLDMAERLGRETGARFIYYLRSKTERDIAVRLLNESEYFIGLKVGTDTDDIAPIIEGVKEGCGLVIWGVGDRSTKPASLGTKGHTSGINVVFARASDAINNAQRSGDLQASQRIEDEISAFEEIRFRHGRMYNYAAVVEAMHQLGSDMIDGGDGGPFNPRVPQEIAREVAVAIAKIKHYH